MVNWRKGVLVAAYVVTLGTYLMLAGSNRDVVTFGTSAGPLCGAAAVAVIAAVLLASPVDRWIDSGAGRVRTGISIFIPILAAAISISDEANRVATGEPDEVACRVASTTKGTRSGLFKNHLVCSLPDGSAQPATGFFSRQPVVDTGKLRATVRRGMLGVWLLETPSVH